MHVEVGKRPALKRLVRGVAVSVAGLYAFAGSAGRLGYRAVLYPAPRSDDVAPPAGARILELRAADGAVVHAMAFEDPRATRTVVYFHGNGEVIGDEVDTAQALRALGLAVTLVEYRGYGRSRDAGGSTEEGLYADASAVLDDLAARGVGPERIVLWGLSLGTGVAVEMAKRGRGAALVLVAPYTSIPDMASRIVPWLPMDLIIGDKFDNLAKAPSLRVPTVVVHGTNDEVIPFAMGERLAGAIAGARFEGVKGAHHMDAFEVDRGLMRRVVEVVAR